MLSRHDATGLRAGKAVGEGRPESEDLPPSENSNPSRKGGFVLRFLLGLTTACAVLVGALVTGASGATTAPRPTAAFPVTVTAANGKLTLSRAPRRIVSLSATATESLFAIGAGAQVVAVDDQSDYPKTAPKTTLSGFTPNVEAIVAYRPDLVIAAYDPKGLVDALGRLGIPVLVHNAAATLPGAYQQIRQLGLVTGKRAGATKVVGRMKAGIGRIVARTKGRARGLSVYHELTPDLYSATSSTFIGRAYGLLGLRNIADAADSAGTGYPQLSPEYVVAASPDLIVLADSVCCGQKPSTVAARPGWGTIDAVRTGSIVRIDDSIASRWGPRLVDFFRALSSAIARLKA
jgi:iron complex transport system substrate-binding protein